MQQTATVQSPDAKKTAAVASPSSSSAATIPDTRKMKETPLPLRQVIPMGIVIVNESLCSTMLMPFVGIFIAHLQNVPKESAGYTAGVLVGVFMLGQVASAKTWGWLSDQYGRRFPLISGLFTSGVMMLLFGLSTNVWMCAFFRFLHGLFNGNILVAKTMMADITDKTNEASGFSFMSLCTAFGFLVGPMLGGLLYNPVEKPAFRWAHLDPDGIFGRHPAFLPCLVIFCYTNIGMLVCTFFVQESNPNAKPLPWAVKLIYPCFLRKAEPFVPTPIRYVEEEEGETPSHAESADHAAGRGTMDVFSSIDREDSRLMDEILAEESLASIPACVDNGFSRHDSIADYDRESLAEEHRRHGQGPRRNHGVSEREMGDDAGSHVSSIDQMDDKAAEVVVVEDSTDEGSQEEEILRKFGYKQAFERPVTRFMLIQYMILSGSDIAVRECFPLWAVAKIEDGGLGLTEQDVGFLLLFNCIPCLVSNILFRVIFKRYANKMGFFRIGVLGAGIASLLIPFNSYIPGPVNFKVFLSVYLCTSLLQVCCSWCYSLNTLLTARAAPLGHVGSIMGINQSCGALVRGIVPMPAGVILAWSLRPGHIFPFNHVLLFVLTAASFFFCFWNSYRLLTTINGKPALSS